FCPLTSAPPSPLPRCSSTPSAPCSRPTPLSSSTLPPPPRSTLFPYTTLFRSPLRRRPTAPATSATWRCPRSSITACAASRSSSRDRKSTRLNSSHVSISYAVFCLKKKKYRQADHTSDGRSSYDVASDHRTDRC